MTAKRTRYAWSLGQRPFVLHASLCDGKSWGVIPDIFIDLIGRIVPGSLLMVLAVDTVRESKTF
jgi:hypothetical protein